MIARMRHRTHGRGDCKPELLATCGEDCVFERDVLIFHPENVHLGRNVYVGHRTILKGYYKNESRLFDRLIVGIGVNVTILTSQHNELGRHVPPLSSPVETAPVVIEDEVNIGVGSIVLPGVRIGRGAKIGAGSVVTRDVAPFTIVAGVPARFLRERPTEPETKREPEQHE